MEVNSKALEKAWEILIELLPEWIKDKANIFLLADQELVIHQAKGYEVHIKKDRCIQCGECCLETPKKHTPFGSNDELKCNALYKEGDRWLCDAGSKKPFKCLADPLKVNVSGCAITYFIKEDKK